MLEFIGGITAGFWLTSVLLFYFVVSIISTEFELPNLGILSFISTLVGLELLAGVPILSNIIENWFLVIAYWLLFLLVGALVVIFWRWPLYITSKKDVILERYKIYSKNMTFEEYVSSSSYDFKPAYMVNMITGWVATWPCSLLWDLLHRPIKFGYNFVYSSIESTLESIGKKIAINMYNNSQKEKK